MVEASFKNQSKKYYNLVLDHLLSKKQGNQPEEMTKKEIFKFLNCEEILPAFLLIYLVFSGIFNLISQLLFSFDDICQGAKEEAIKNLGEFEDEKEKQIESSRKEREYDVLVEWFQEIKDQTSKFFIEKFEKCIKRVESKISSVNILELRGLHQFMKGLFDQMEVKHSLQSSTLRSQF